MEVPYPGPAEVIMLMRRVSTTCIVVLLVAGLGLTMGCWKSNDDSEVPAADAVPNEQPVDLGRDDMAALPGADVDLQLLSEFPYHLRQVSSMAPDAIFGYYDEFFGNRGWSVETALDPLNGASVHTYRLDHELAAVSVRELEPGRHEVLLNRRELREEEKTASSN